MTTKIHRHSIFAQPIDRALFIAYFLGAIVPFFAFGYVAQRFVFPVISSQQHFLSLIIVVVSMALLSLGAFLVIRGAAHHALARMNEDNRRLATLLKASGSLGGAPHRAEAARLVIECALELTPANVALLLAREKTESSGRWDVLHHDGENAPSVYVSHEVLLRELAELAREGGRPVVRAAETGSEDGLSFCVVPLSTKRDATGVIAIVRDGPANAFSSADLDSLATLAGLGAAALSSSDTQDMQRNFFVQVTDVLVSALDTHLGFQEGHSRQVAEISNSIAREMGLDGDRRERLHFAALLHDIGMLRIARDQHENRKAIQRHPALGAKTLSAIRVWEDLAPFVLHHHEWFDGHGYPAGVAGQNIPLESRILGLAEAVDSMTSPTSYKAVLAPEEALRRVRESSGSQFDPEVVDTFLRLIDGGQIDLAKHS